MQIFFFFFLSSHMLAQIGVGQFGSTSSGVCSHFKSPNLGRLLRRTGNPFFIRPDISAAVIYEHRSL